MKVIFLDIDGVLKNKKCYEMVDGNRTRHTEVFAPECVENLKKILDKTGANIVISSLWRRDGLEYLKSIFESNGIDSSKIIGMTPYKDIAFGIRPAPRGDEIKEWLDENSEKYNVEKFIIIDDDDNMGQLKHHLIKTSHLYGLAERSTRTAISKLGREKVIKDKDHDPALMRLGEKVLKDADKAKTK